MRKVSRDTILELTVKGLNKAQEKYLEWNGDTEGLSNGAEYVATTYIAETIGSSDEIGALYVEEHVKTLFKQYGKDKIPNDCRDGRVDIAIYLKNDTPLAIIEVKNNVSFEKKVGNDIERINCLLDEGIIQYGIIAFISEFEDKNLTQDDIEKHTIKIIKNSKPKDIKYKYYTEMFEPTPSYEGKSWGWSSVAILFHK